MIAPAEIPENYKAWNDKWHAPFGRPVPFGGPLSWSKPLLWFRGPFAVQPNSEARRFEYPWVYEQVQRLPRGSSLVEIGGGLSGFQFVLSREGYDVTNVDPGMAAKGRGWPVTAEKHRSLSRLFRAPVRLIPTVIEKADIRPQSIDGVVCISTLEHLTPTDLEGVAGAIKTILRPGGLLVLTVDLFLDLQPFTNQTKNEWGTNIDVRSFLQRAGLELKSGDRRQILGFPEFDRDAILQNRKRFISDVSGVALAQCMLASPV